MSSSIRIKYCLTKLLKQRVGAVETLKLSVRQAGHSHWHNIRHVKGANDKIKGDKASQLAMRVRQALIESGSPEVKSNPSLAKAVKFGEDNNIPSKSIQAIIAKAWAADKNKQMLRVEARGPSGSFLIFTVATDDLKRTKSIINKSLARCGGTVLSLGGTVTHFTEKGVILATSTDAKPTQLDEAEEIAISVDAEDVEIVANSESNSTSFRFTCDPSSLSTVVERLEKVTQVAIDDFRVEPVPNVLVDLSTEEKSNIDTTLNFLKAHPALYLELVYDNVRWN